MLGNLSHFLASLTFHSSDLNKTVGLSFPACTIDRHFVFSVPAAIVDPPLSPAMLLTFGNATCKPEKVTSEYALFKIPMDGCGAHKVVSCAEKKNYSINDQRFNLLSLDNHYTN